MTEETGESMNLTPHFNYHRHVEIVKRFIEQLVIRTSEPFPTDDAFMDFVDYIRRNSAYVRSAMGEILADDIERQIQITKDFPLGPQMDGFHSFKPTDERHAPDLCASCGRLKGGGARERAEHTL
jgi:hypothetical protein